ncbi:MAG: hypothetical protein JSW51_07560 [Gemmatimonadota bacterium]|nr:MAG: hypothetical protein JSW51_07560 [Gemmatimonadota bacterium]
MGVYDVSGTRPRTGKTRAVKGRGGAAPSGKRTAILIVVAIVAVGTAVALNVLPPMLSQPDVTIPEEIQGVWVTRAEHYADRSFEISPTTVLFKTGPGEAEFTFHEVVDVERSQGQDGMEYTFVYADGLRFGFIYNAIQGTIQLANQRDFFWTREGATPTTIAALPPTAVETDVSGESESGGDVAVTQPQTDQTQAATSSGQTIEGETELLREVYSFQGTGRDPFLSLLRSNDIRPLPQDLTVTSVTYDASYSTRSVALLRDTVANKAYPVRVGDELGRLRVVEINPGNVVLVMDEFGSERRIVLNQRLRPFERRRRPRP